MWYSFVLKYSQPQCEVQAETHPILGQPAKYNFNGIVNHPHNNNGMNVEIYVRALADLPFLVDCNAMSHDLNR